jgi:lauroyl/myristoyl acyltransferase/predicted metal-dependent phosphoesterase TrpH
LAATETQPEAEAASPLTDKIVLAVVVVLARITWLIPWSFWNAVATVGGIVTMFTKRRREVLNNVRHARAGRQPNPIRAWWIASQQITSHLRIVIGTLRGAHRLPEDSSLVLEGLDHVRPYLGQRGLIIVSGHAGPYTMLGLMAQRWLAASGFEGELAIVVRMFRPFRSGALMDWFLRYFTEVGVTVISVHEQPQVMAKKLRSVLENNGIVVLLVDEPTPTPSLNVPFFDSTIKMPLGPVRLARASNALIVPTLASWMADGRMKITLTPPQEPTGGVAEAMARMAKSLQDLIDRNLDQWAMLTDLWIDPPLEIPEGHALADLHLHTTGSDGLLEPHEWLPAAQEQRISVLGIMDHDHLETVRRWKAADPEGTKHVIPGVEISARGRIVHLGVLFPEALPDEIPPRDTPLLEIMRWARSVPGSIVILVHPLPGLWRHQLRKMARAGLLPDAIESRFPFGGNGRRTAGIERAAREYKLAVLGSSDSHLLPGQVGAQATLFPGTTPEDLVQAIRERRTVAIERPQRVRVPGSVPLLQTVYSWLLPFRSLPGVEAVRANVLQRARKGAGLATDAPPCRKEVPLVPASEDRTQVS